MVDPIKTALATLGTAFAAGVAWMTLKNRVVQVRRDLNGLGGRVKRTEDADADLRGHFDELREHVNAHREWMLERDSRIRERLARIESQLGIPPIGESS